MTLSESPSTHSGKIIGARQFLSGRFVNLKKCRRMRACYPCYIPAENDRQSPRVVSELGSCVEGFMS